LFQLDGKASCDFWKSWMSAFGGDVVDDVDVVCLRVLGWEEKGKFGNAEGFPSSDARTELWLMWCRY
jgi:hypothetical protein